MIVLVEIVALLQEEHRLFKKQEEQLSFSEKNNNSVVTKHGNASAKEKKLKQVDHIL